MWSWITKPVISSTGILVAIDKNTLYDWIDFSFMQKIIRILSKDHAPWRYFVNVKTFILVANTTFLISIQVYIKNIMYVYLTFTSFQLSKTIFNMVWVNINSTDLLLSKPILNSCLTILAYSYNINEIFTLKLRNNLDKVNDDDAEANNLQRVAYCVPFAQGWCVHWRVWGRVWAWCHNGHTNHGSLSLHAAASLPVPVRHLKSKRIFLYSICYRCYEIKYSTTDISD